MRKDWRYMEIESQVVGMCLAYDFFKIWKITFRQKKIPGKLGDIHIRENCKRLVQIVSRAVSFYGTVAHYISCNKANLVLSALYFLQGIRLFQKSA